MQRINKDTSDLDLYKRIAKGKAEGERAFAELYARFGNRVFMYCVKILGDDRDAQDVYQETFIRFHRAAQKEYEVQNVPSYLFKIARNLCYNHRRDKKQFLDLEDFSFSSRDESYERRDLLNLIETALGLLDIKYREAFVLKEYEGMSYSQIAEITGDTVPALKNRVWRAKERIRSILSPYLADIEKFQ